MLYLIQCSTMPYFKVGFADRDAESRRRDLQCGCPMPLRLLATCDGDRAAERELHRALQDSHALGEWFVGTSSTIKLLQSRFQVAVKCDGQEQEIAAAVMFEQKISELKRARDNLHRAIAKAADLQKAVDHHLEAIDGGALLRDLALRRDEFFVRTPADHPDREAARQLIVDQVTHDAARRP